MKAWILAACAAASLTATHAWAKAAPLPPAA
ncbi:MAG: hypothetical protein JWQ46_1391, partial [Phenylobacterium sp.]|nr:hypothetical protein [Phenylobacterium sp.]